MNNLQCNRLLSIGLTSAIGSISLSCVLFARKEVLQKLPTNLAISICFILSMFFFSAESGKIEFADFCGILARTIKESDPETELAEAFKVSSQAQCCLSLM